MKRGIDIIRAMLKVDRIAEEEAARPKQPLPCQVIIGDNAKLAYLREYNCEFQEAVNRGARVPGSLFRDMVQNTPMEVIESETFKKDEL